MVNQKAIARNTQWSPLLPYLALAFLILGAKFAYIYYYGLNIPFFDQWGPEATIIDDAHRGHVWSTLFDSYGQHRIILTRIITIGLLLLNNQWDVLLEMIVNCFAHLACALVLFRIIENLFGKLVQLIGFILITLLFVLPFGWENALWGFQSQFYFLELFSILAIYYLIAKAPEPKNIILGWIFVVLAMVNMASGFFCSVVIVAISLLYLVFNQGSRKVSMWQLLCGIVFIALGVHLLGIPVDSSLKAATFGDFISIFHSYLNWPLSLLSEDVLGAIGRICFIPFAFFICLVLFVFLPQLRARKHYSLLVIGFLLSILAVLLALSMMHDLILDLCAKYKIPLSYFGPSVLKLSEQFQLPFLQFGTYLNSTLVVFFYKAIICLMPLVVLVYALFILRFSEFRTRKNYFILGFALWIFMQMAAFAYGRNTYGVPLSRYTDLISLWLLVYLFCLASLLQFLYAKYARFAEPKWRKRTSIVLIIFSTALLYGLLYVSALSVGFKMPKRKSICSTQIQNTSGYVQSKDAGYIDNKASWEIPFPIDSQYLKEVLNRESTRYYLPAELREHLPMASIADGADLKFNECEPLPGSLNDFTVGPYYTNYSKQENKVFLSKVIKAVVGLPYIKLWLAGNGSVTVFVKSEKTGKVIDSVSVYARDKKWKALDLKQPKEAYQIEVQSAADTNWFAVTAPREQGRFSHWVKPILLSYPLVFILGLLLSICWIRAQWAQVKDEENS